MGKVLSGSVYQPGMGAMAIMKEAHAAKLTGRGMFALIGLRLGIDYSEKRESERLVSIADDGEGMWTKGNWPDSHNTIEEAFAKVGRIEALWYHCPSMNLVLFDGEQKVGIRSTDFRVFGLGVKPERIQAIIDGLTANARDEAN